MSPSETDERQELELLAGLVLGDLSEPESDYVESLLNRPENREALWELETAAAGVQLAFSPSMTMPEGIYERIREEGVRMVSTPSDSLAADFEADSVKSEDQNLRRALSPEAATPGEDAVVKPSGASFGGREMIAWLCAAAAILVAVTLWQPNAGSDSGGRASASLSEQRADLIQTATDLIEVSWGAGTTPLEDEVTGDVVWDAKTQKGYMRFVNLPVNDPTVEQYQLWIIDPKRDSNPVDGGVFDITSKGEVIVLIDAKLDVISPAAFAITIEQPGGVVVSSQERLPLLAAVEG